MFATTGGGFGGKETRFYMLSVPVAVAAHKLQCSVRAMLDRDEDMLMTGNRHPFYAKYKVSDLHSLYAKYKVSRREFSTTENCAILG